MSALSPSLSLLFLFLNVGKEKTTIFFIHRQIRGVRDKIIVDSSRHAQNRYSVFGLCRRLAEAKSDLDILPISHQWFFPMHSLITLNPIADSSVLSIVVAFFALLCVSSPFHLCESNKQKGHRSTDICGRWCWWWHHQDGPSPMWVKKENNLDDGIKMKQLDLIASKKHNIDK